MSRQISPSWRQDRDWLYVSFLAISDCKLLTYSKSDIHAFRKEVATRPIAGLENNLSAHYTYQSSFQSIFKVGNYGLQATIKKAGPFGRCLNHLSSYLLTS